MRKKEHYPFAEFLNGIPGKRTRSSHNESMNNVTSSSSSDNETTPKFRKSFEKNINANFNKHMTMRCEFIIKADNEVFNMRSKTPMIY